MLARMMQTTIRLRAAISAVLFMKGKEMIDLIVKSLRKINMAEVIRLDQLSGFSVWQWVSSTDAYNDESWGIYLANQLIGYCTIGYADDQCPVITDHELWSEDSYQLSDVFIAPAYRNNGYGSKLVRDAIKGRYLSEGVRPVFLQPITKQVMQFYQTIGFLSITNNIGYDTMILKPEDLEGD